MYVGRFAPSPTGPLHFGSAIAAIASWLDARAAGGRWLLRIEDIDTPRIVAGAEAMIVEQLVSLGLDWDDAITRQSDRTGAYRAAIDSLRARGHLYPCACSRREIADAQGPDGGPLEQVYPGTCRQGISSGRRARATRVRAADRLVTFRDRCFGECSQNVATAVGDFVIHRADGLFAYQLAVVVDDSEQGVTDVVRGADLLDSTPRQMHLQRLLGFETPRYLHIPVAVDEDGKKLSKSQGAAAIGSQAPAMTWERVLDFLAQEPPPGLEIGPLKDWAVHHWNPTRIPRRRALFLPS